MVEIRGIQKVSMIDFPGKLAPTVFLGKCNFRCPFCHNPELVLDTEQNLISEEDFFKFLEEKEKWLDGVCITGGEPTLNPDLPEFIKKLKALGLAVKLDTNGTNPGMLKELIKKKMLDYVAMDIKAPLEKYDEITCVAVDKNAIQESVRLIMESGVDYEFRTTVVPELFNIEDALKISSWIKGAKRYYLQQFSTENALLNPEFRKKATYTREMLQEICNKIKDSFEVCEVRAK
jgi:pyruvate formate lyase activating enzyme